MGPRWLQLCYFAEGRSPKRQTIVLTLRLEWRQYIFALYTSFIYSLFIELVKRLLQKTKEFHCKYNVYLFVCLFVCFVLFLSWKCPACLICTTQRFNSASCVCCAQTCHHRPDHLGLLLEKTIYGFKKTIYGFEVISAE